MADHRLVFGEKAQADELKIEAQANPAGLLPGDEAQRYLCTNSDVVKRSAGRTRTAVVDEAVFALAEKQPGFAKVPFHSAKPWPRAKSTKIGMPDIVEPVPLTRLEQRDRAARALFSATETGC